MGLFNKVMAIAEKTVDATKTTAQAAKQAYEEGGLEAVGFKAGQATKELGSDIGNYVEQVAKEAKKAGKPAGIAFNKEQPTAQAAAKIALGVIAGMRKVGLDAVDKINNLDNKENNSEQPKINKPKI